MPQDSPGILKKFRLTVVFLELKKKKKKKKKKMDSYNKNGNPDVRSWFFSEASKRGWFQLPNLSSILKKKLVPLSLLDTAEKHQEPQLLQEEEDEIIDLTNGIVAMSLEDSKKRCMTKKKRRRRLRRAFRESTPTDNMYSYLFFFFFYLNHISHLN